MTARRLALFLLALAGTLAGLAMSWQGPWWALAWPAGSGALLAAAYLRGAAGALGKRADGTIAPWSWLLFGPYLAFTLVVWHLSRLSRESPRDEVAPGLWLGRRLLPGELPPGVTTVIDLTAELPEPGPIRRLPGYRCLPTLDAHVPESGRFAALVEELGPAPEPLLIHCAQGHVRSATLAAALLIRRGLAEGVDAAEASLRQARPGVRLKPTQRAFLGRWLQAR